MSRLRVHIQNDAEGPEALVLTAPQLEAAAAARPALAGRIAASDGRGEAPGSVPADTDVLLTSVKLPLDQVRAHAPQLRWVQTTFAGVEGILAGMPADLQLANASGVHTEKGGEFVLTAALMLSYRIPNFLADQAAKRWMPRFEPPLRARRVTLLGVGGIGSGAAPLLRALGCTVTGVTRSGTAPVTLDAVVEASQLDRLLPTTDILVSTLPHTPQTQGLIDRRRVNLLPVDAGIVVVGRAAVLDYAAIMDRLDAGTLSGAVLDVFPVEPLPQADRIWRTPRLIVSPHCSVDDHSTYLARCVEIFLDNIENDLASRPLANLVDPARGY